ncbi:TPA: hypothetical protein EYP38_00680 [Candidatus Micrarchaeota archaeon]|nr:hypothetical protein [Candidatus Micrarchaeota archaeon]
MDVTKQLAFSVLGAFKKRKQRSLRKLNDRILKEAAINFTKPLFRLAVLSYVLAKIVQKPRFLQPEHEKQLKAVENALKDAAISIGRVVDSQLLKNFKKVETAITSLERKDRRYLIGLVQKGELKTAATLYAQGISLGVAAEMTGMEKQEIMDYAGDSMMFERVKEELGIRERIKMARRFLGGSS